jgi:hypothetical protein
MNIKTRIEISENGEDVLFIADEDKYDIKKGTAIAGMPKFMYNDWIRMFKRDPEYDEILGLMREMKRRHGVR